jgi:hypothetical protein
LTFLIVSLCYPRIRKMSVRLPVLI